MELGWIDYSEQDRRRTMAVLAALREPAAVDELGIGIIRDAFASIFFPATSVLLTRAKYFFLVPYALRDLERKDNAKKSAESLRRAYDDTEKSLAIDLIRRAEDTAGIIGARTLRRDFSGTWVKRGPGEIYWAPLRQLGILKSSDMGYSGYFKYASKCTGQTVGRATWESKESGWNDDDAARKSVWNIPGRLFEDWRDDVSIELTKDEAAFLRDQIILSHPKSLYALLLRDTHLRNIALRLYRMEDWETDDIVDFEATGSNVFHAFDKEAHGDLLGDMSNLVGHAIAFSNFIYGCRIRYNALLAGHEEEAEQEWSSYAPASRAYADALDIEAVSSLPGILRHGGSASLFSFLNRAKGAMAAGDIRSLDHCIVERERRIKHGRAKIGRIEGVPESWRGGRRLSYRFGIAASIISEIESAGGCNA